MSVVTRIRTSQKLTVPYTPEEVWAVLADVVAYPDWWPAKLGVEVLHHPGDLLGAEFEVRPLMGRVFRVRFEELDRTRSMRLRFFGGSLEGPGGFHLQALDGATLVRYEMDVFARGFDVAVLSQVLPLERIHGSRMRSVLRSLAGRLKALRRAADRKAAQEARSLDRERAILREAEEAADRRLAEEGARRRVEEEAAGRAAAEEAAAARADAVKAERRAAEEGAARLAAEESARKLAGEAAAARAAVEEARGRAAEEEAARLTAEEAAKSLAEEAAVRTAVEEAERRAAEEETARLTAEEAARKLTVEAAAARAAAEEAERRAASEGAARLAAEEAARKLAEAAAAARAVAEEAERRAAEEHEARLAAEKAAKIRADEAAAARVMAEDAERRAAEEHAARLAAEEAAKRQADETAAALLVAEEAERRAAGKEAARRAAEEARSRPAAALIDEPSTGSRLRPLWAQVVNWLTEPPAAPSTASVSVVEPAPQPAPGPKASTFEIARQYLDGLSSGATPEEIGRYLAPDVTDEEFPHRFLNTAVTRGFSTFQKARAGARVRFSSERYEFVGATGGGSQVAMEVRWKGSVATTAEGLTQGQELDARMAFFFKFEGERIVRQRRYACFEPWSTKAERILTLDERVAQAGQSTKTPLRRSLAAPIAPNASNFEIARSYLAALEARADAETVARFYAPDAVQDEFPNRFLPGGAHRDLQAIRIARSRGLALMASEGYELLGATGSGSMVALEVAWSGVVANGLGFFTAGERLEARLGIFLKFRDGLIVAQRSYTCAPLET